MKTAQTEISKKNIGFDWSNEKLWALDVPISKVHIKTLSWHILRPIWSSKKGHDLQDLSPFNVLKNPDLHIGHYQRILNADLKYPIDCIWIKGRYFILDGVHRLAKLIQIETLEIKIRKIKKEHIKLIEIT